MEDEKLNTINSTPLESTQSVPEYSPINGDKLSNNSSIDKIEISPVNPGEPVKSYENPVKNESSIVSQNEELSKPLSNSSTENSVINISLDRLKETQIPLNNTSNYTTINNISNTSNIVNTAIKNDQPTTTSSSLNTINEPTFNNSESTNNFSNSNSITNSNISSTLEKAKSIINEIVDMPKINDFVNQTKEYFGTSINSTNEKISSITDKIFSDTTNSNINLKDTRIESSIEKIKDLTSVNSSKEITNNLTLDRKNIEVAKSPTVNEITQNTSSNSNSNTSTSSTNNSTTSENTSNSLSTQTNSIQSTNSQVVAQQVQPAPQAQPIENIVNVDLSQLVNSINRLERILLSGIDVNLKDNY